MPETIAGVAVPDTEAAAEATRRIAATVEPLLFHHSRRVFLFGSLLARAAGLRPDPELLYLASLFHDSGLLTPFGTIEQRFELDGADHARAFALAHGFPGPAADTVWEAVALHSTPGIPQRMGAEIAATNLGVLTDAVGMGLDTIDPGAVEEIVGVHPRGAFKAEFPALFVRGLEHRPATAYGTVNADVLERFSPGYRRVSMVERIAAAPWPS